MNVPNIIQEIFLFNVKNVWNAKYFCFFFFEKGKNEAHLSKIGIALARVRDFFCTFVPIIK